MTTLYGIKNCDTIKKARKWLADNGIEYTFHDVRTDGIDGATIEKWIEQTDWETIHFGLKTPIALHVQAKTRKTCIYLRNDVVLSQHPDGGRACQVL